MEGTGHDNVAGHEEAEEVIEDLEEVTETQPPEEMAEVETPAVETESEELLEKAKKEREEALLQAKSIKEEAEQEAFKILQKNT